MMVWFIRQYWPMPDMPIPKRLQAPASISSAVSGLSSRASNIFIAGQVGVQGDAVLFNHLRAEYGVGAEKHAPGRNPGLPQGVPGQVHHLHPAPPHGVSSRGDCFVYPYTGGQQEFIVQWGRGVGPGEQVYRLPERC